MSRGFACQMAPENRQGGAPMPEPEVPEDDSTKAGPGPDDNLERVGAGPSAFDGGI
jgi:hypothetical protein